MPHPMRCPRTQPPHPERRSARLHRQAWDLAAGVVFRKVLLPFDWRPDEPPWPSSCGLPITSWWSRAPQPKHSFALRPTSSFQPRDSPCHLLSSIHGIHNPWYPVHAFVYAFASLYTYRRLYNNYFHVAPLTTCSAKVRFPCRGQTWKAAPRPARGSAASPAQRVPLGRASRGRPARSLYKEPRHTSRKPPDSSRARTVGSTTQCRFFSKVRGYDFNTEAQRHRERRKGKEPQLVRILTRETGSLM